MNRLFDSLAFHALALPFCRFPGPSAPNPDDINAEPERCPFIRPAPYNGLS